ncbi:MAG: hypothetical protein E5X92_23100, partial [Mesorhizobium sp.]
MPSGPDRFRSTHRDSRNCDLGWHKPAKCDKGSALRHKGRASDGLDMHRVIISGIGAEIPEPVITNE